MTLETTVIRGLALQGVGATVGEAKVSQGVWEMQELN